MAYVREYRTRLVDQQLRRLLASVPAVSVNGARAVGKTRTAQAVAGSFFPLDDPTDWDQVEALDRHFSGVPTPIVLDEWQRMPRLWDRVRRAVDQDYTPGRFLLTGSSTPSQAPTHTGAGRIVTLRMRPFSLVERGLETAPTVSLAGLLASDAGQARQEDPTTPAAALPPVSGRTTVTIDQYVDEICRSGFPAIREQDAYARESFFSEAWARRKGPMRPDGHILVDTGRLRRSIQSRTTENSITFFTNEPYAAIHNEGGEIVVTKKMKRYFWRKHYDAVGAFDRKKDGSRSNNKRTLQLAGEAEFWKFMALKKVGSTIKIPRRRFLGTSPEVEKAVREIIERNITEYINFEFEINEK